MMKGTGIESDASYIAMGLPLPGADPLLAKAELLLCERAYRGDWFGACYLGDIPWTILLILYAAQERDRTETVNAIFKTVNAPHTTVLRWIHTLATAELVRLSPGDCDRRLTQVRLAPEAYDRMRGYLVTVAPRPD